MADKEIKFEKFGTELPEDLKAEFDVACSKRRLTLKAGIQQAVKMWLQAVENATFTGNDVPKSADLSHFRLQFEKPLRDARRHAETLRAEADKADDLVSEIQVALESRQLAAARKSLPAVPKKRGADGTGPAIGPHTPRSGTGSS